MSRHHQAFSLLELLIVILIISVVYMLVFGSMEREHSKPKALNIKNIKETLAKQGLLHTKSELFCIDECQKCYIYKDGETTEYEGDIALGAITAYEVDKEDSLQKIDFGRYQDHPVCLRFKLYTNTSSSQMIIQNKTGVYYLPSLFGEVAKTSSPEKAKDLWLKDANILSNSGDFY